MRYRLFLTMCLSFLFLVFVAGCASKKVQTEPAPAQVKKSQETKTVEKVTPEPKPQKPEEVPPTPMEAYELDYAKLPLQHTVVKGECLWWIAEYKQIYNDPFMWPLIYKANRDKINDPDLIYPGQTFYIPRNFSLTELKDSRRSAGAPKPYSPPESANIPAQIRSKLGWGFE